MAAFHSIIYGRFWVITEGKPITIVPVILLREGDKPGKAYEVTRHGVETGGLWVDSSFLTEGAGDLAPTAEFPVFFLPFAGIHLLIGYSLQLDERSLAV